MDKYFKYLEYVTDESDCYVRPTPKPTEEFSFDFDIGNLHEDWVINKDDTFWTMYYHVDGHMQMQGWKIHVSTAYENATATLDIVSRILYDMKIPFKHVKNESALFHMYSKHGNRISAGKFITIYPKDEEFILLLDTLHKALEGLPKGPYILTDKQWRDGNVYFRYGAFRKLVNDAGIPCIYNPIGELIPDERLPRYYLPDFVTEPEGLKDDNQDNNIQDAENNLKLYKIEKVIRFSNAGGIYAATRISDNKKCVIKEARHQIGLDISKKNAKERLDSEYAALVKLQHIEGIVNIFDYFKVWDNTFLVVEFVEGKTLSSWMSANYPYSTKADTSDYFNDVIIIMEKLKNIVTEMHCAGIAMCDLQPQNVVVGDFC